MNELTIRNRQRKHKIALKPLKESTRWVLEEQLSLKSYSLGIEIVSTEKMAEINWQFLRHEGPTDVITFSYAEEISEPGTERPELHGEIYICPDVARRYAKEFKVTLGEETARYMVHGILHLLGYDDLSPDLKRIMKREENKIVRLLGKRFKLSGIAKA